MTTETERRVPEHPGWQPHWVRMADCDGRTVYLIDEDRRLNQNVHRWARFAVQEFPGIPCDEDDCDERDSEHAAVLCWTDSLADAEAAFDLACERLREGG